MLCSSTFCGCKPYCCRTHIPAATALHSTATCPNPHREATQLACPSSAGAPELATATTETEHAALAGRQALPGHKAFPAQPLLPHVRPNGTGLPFCTRQLEASRQRGEEPVPFRPFPSVLGQRVREGTAREIAYAAPSAKPVPAVLVRRHRARHRRVKNLLITPGPGEVWLPPPPASTESSFDQIQRGKDLYPLGVCIPKFSVQRHSTLIGLQSLSLYLTNDNTVN